MRHPAEAGAAFGDVALATSGDSFGARRLIQAVLIQAIKDAVKETAGISDPYDRRKNELARLDARALFRAMERAPDLRELCELARVDYEHLLRLMLSDEGRLIRERLVAAIHRQALEGEGQPE